MQPSTTSRPRPFTPAAAAGLGLVVVLGIAFRLYARSDLWLDEALSANISALPVSDLLEQLRHDGHPPLYYLLLHGWMQVFGEGDVAVRSLSGVFGVAALPLTWIAARRYGGPRTAAAALVLLTTSPFAIRYATETRMYSLVMLLVVAGWLVLRAALDRPTTARLAGVALVSGLLALSHYWSFYLLAATGLLLLWLWRRGAPAALRSLLALVAGGVLFLPWLPSFLEQAANTGTPWGRPERPTNILAISFTDWGGGPNGEAQLLGLILLLCVLLALFGRGIAGSRIELDLRTRAEARPEFAVATATMAIAVVAAYATAGAFASRYTAVVFPLVVLLAGLGASRIPAPKILAGLLVVAALLGTIGGVRNVRSPRTQAGDVAAYIAEHGTAGDVVAFCPDQLGPAVTRNLPEGFRTYSFPDGGDSRFVDWVDYEERQATVRPRDFAAEVDRLGGAENTVWLVWSGGYRTLDDRCERTVSALRRLRPGGRAVKASGREFEHMWLYQYGPVPG